MGALPQNSQGRPWNGDYVFSSGDLVEDLTHNFFLETGARNGKLKVYETVEHPAARALTGFLLVRGGVHQVAYARALERLTGADLMKLFPSPRIPTDKIPECQPHIKRGDHLRLYRFSPDDYKELAAVFNGPHPETGEELIVEDESPAGFPAHDLPSEPSVFAPDYAPEEIAAIAEKLRVQAGLPKQPTGEVANGNAPSKPRGTRSKGVQPRSRQYGRPPPGERKSGVGETEHTEQVAIDTCYLLRSDFWALSSDAVPAAIRDHPVDHQQDDCANDRGQPGGNVEELVQRVCTEDRGSEEPAKKGADDANDRCNDETARIFSGQNCLGDDPG